jgi:hypothetical protein
MSSLVFLHLSDIHFQRNAGSTYDPHVGLRNELELDIKNFTAATFKHVNGILITGDVAYSGHPDEYAYARTWIEKIAGILKLIPGEDVFVIPGNHDIQRDAGIVTQGHIDVFNPATGLFGFLGHSIVDVGIGTLLQHLFPHSHGLLDPGC